MLVGLMGAGKTTVGRLLATRLGRPFHDSDVEVERRCGVPVAQVFDIEGEAGFRARERAVLAELAARRGIVLATGGGAVLEAENRARLAASGTVVYLHGRPECLAARVRGDRGRPLLAGADPLARLEALYAERDRLYRQIAHLVVEADRCGSRRLARELAEVLKARWRRCT